MKVGTYDFATARSKFHVSVRNGETPLAWYLEFEAEEREIDEMDWEPHISNHFLRAPWPGLDRLPGLPLDLPGPPAVEYRSPDFREADFMLYQWDHMPICDVTIRFGDWEPRGIGFRFAGVVDLLEDRFPGYTPVSVQGVLPFDGVSVGQTDPVAAERGLARHFERSRFGSREPGPRGTFFPFVAGPVFPVETAEAR